MIGGSGGDEFVYVLIRDEGHYADYMWSILGVFDDMEAMKPHLEKSINSLPQPYRKINGCYEGSGLGDEMVYYRKVKLNTLDWMMISSEGDGE